MLLVNSCLVTLMLFNCYLIDECLLALVSVTLDVVGLFGLVLVRNYLL